MTKKGEIINRIGEKTTNNFESEMIIVNQYRYNNVTYIDAYFPEYNYISKQNKYDNFKSGTIKCPYEPRVYGYGYLGEGKYKASENGKITKCYNVWHHMLERCYDDKLKEKEPTYKGCIVEDYWLNFQNFAEWYYENYYELENEVVHLDKDILHKGNKIYSHENCIFVPQGINKLFTKRQNYRGDLPIGVCLRDKGYMAKCSNGGKPINLGTYPTPEEAFQVYKTYKEQVIKDTIDLYEGIIPEPQYSRLKKIIYNYEVKIDD